MNKTNANQKLKKDLHILKAMVEELTNYLVSDTLSWPMFKADYPELTLGGYFMRQRRLQVLSYLLTQAEQRELQEIVSQFNHVTLDRKALVEKKAVEELHMRANQWKAHLQDYWDSQGFEQAYYASDVEVRTMITDIIFEMDLDLSLLDNQLLFQIDALDDELRVNWNAGGFIWPQEWIPAYDKGNYWWMYGYPGLPENE